MTRLKTLNEKTTETKTKDDIENLFNFIVTKGRRRVRFSTGNFFHLCTSYFRWRHQDKMGVDAKTPVPQTEITHQRGLSRQEF